jgi:DNA-binding MarR family transcriptional regulator
MRRDAAHVKQDVADVERAMVAIRRGQTRRALARRAGASTTGTEVLDVVEEAEEAGEPATVTSVAAALDVDQPRASKLVAAAVEAGLVRREADQKDGRRALLVRTEEGRRVSAEIHAFRRRAIGAAVEDWSSDERAEFARLLTRFVTAFTPPTREASVQP